MKKLVWLLFLAGCAVPTLPSATRIVTITPVIPAGLLHCALAPDVPDASSQAVVAKYIVALWLAGDDCRAHLAAISEALSK